MHLMGDPGFFSKLKKLSLKKIIKGASPFLGVIPGVGAVAGGLLGAVASTKSPLLTGFPGFQSYPGGLGLNPGFPKGRGLSRGPSSPAGMDGVPRGYHISKTTGNVVKNRHMNPLNPRALRRSMSRVTSFARFAKRTIAFTHTTHLKARGRKRR
jgi:hypothetical protein